MNKDELIKLLNAMVETDQEVMLGFTKDNPTYQKLNCKVLTLLKVIALLKDNDYYEGLKKVYLD